MPQDTLTLVPPWFWLLAAGLVGACVGSFLNVVIARLPARESLVAPGSRCPRCRTPITARDNIPIVSYLLLGGRCRHCRAPISLRYPVVELVTAVLTVAVVRAHPDPLAFLGPALLLAWSLIALSFIDLDHRLLPNRITLPGLALGLALSFLPGGVTPLDALLGALLGGGLLIGLIVVYWLVRRVEGMGFGDVKLLAMIGAFLGVRGVVLALFVGAMLSVVVALVLALSGRLTPAAPPETATGDPAPSWRYAALPFGPFLSLGAIADLLFGGALFSGLTGLSGLLA